MARRLTVVSSLALSVLLAVAGPAAAMGAASASTGESNSPIADQGSSFHYRSEITSVRPQAPGLSIQVLEFADRLLLTNHTGRTVTIYGYSGEPYARVLADGTAEQNVDAPATYLNEDFYGNVNPPATATPGATPKWEVVDRTGRFEWHDHRIHYMSPALPPQVKDRGKRTLVFDWQVPIRVGDGRGAIDGSLYWAPESSKAPLAVLLLGGAIVLGGVLLVVAARRRRRPAAASGIGDGDGGGTGAPPREAW